MNMTLWRLQNKMQRFPGGINDRTPEMEQILFFRDEIEEKRTNLTTEEQKILASIDERLRCERVALLRLLSDPTEFRQRLGIPRSHWWWYLDEEAAAAEVSGV